MDTADVVAGFWSLRRTVCAFIRHVRRVVRQWVGGRKWLCVKLNAEGKGCQDVWERGDACVQTAYAIVAVCVLRGLRRFAFVCGRKGRRGGNACACERCWTSVCRLCVTGARGMESACLHLRFKSACLQLRFYGWGKRSAVPVCVCVRAIRVKAGCIGKGVRVKRAGCALACEVLQCLLQNRVR